MGCLNNIKTRISTHGGGDQGDGRRLGRGDQGDGRRLGREGETRDRDSDNDSQDGNYVASESVPGFKRGRQPTDRAVEKDLFQEIKALGLNNQSVYEHYARVTPK